MTTTLRALGILCLLSFVPVQVAPAQASNSQPAASPTAEATRAASEPVEICLAPASVQMAGGKTDEAIEAVRDVFLSFLNGPTMKATPLTSRLASQAKEEAKQGHCRYVLFVNLTYKKKTGGGLFARAAGDAASTAVWRMPGGGSAGSAAARTAATTVASTALQGMNSNVKAKDEMTLEYRLEAADRPTPVLSKSEKSKASSDGEDLLTPLVEHAAGAIANSVTAK